MEIINALMIISIIILIPVTGIMMFRNEQVFRYRKRVIAYIHELNIRDIDSSDNPMAMVGSTFHRYELFGKVDYNTMMLHFWKSPASFFPDEIRPPERKMGKLRIVK